MDAYEAVITKRDKREYDSRPISEESTRHILQAGRMAGTSSNSQPCRLIVLNDKTVVKELAPAGPGTAPMLRAPLTIAIVVQERGGPFDVGRIAQNMMIAA